MTAGYRIVYGFGICLATTALLNTEWGTLLIGVAFIVIGSAGWPDWKQKETP
jgi:hypothetical protein